jgi:hypothetical protein
LASMLWHLCFGIYALASMLWHLCFGIYALASMLWLSVCSEFLRASVGFT